MNRYFKNFILCGDLDQYCLLCKESFQTIPEIEKHIRWEHHRKCIRDVTLLPKFRKELIYKVGNTYYCEICNVISFNMSSLAEHVACETHKLLKSDPLAIVKKPAGLYCSGYVIINKVILSKEQWNSIVDGKCLVCKIDVHNVDEHIVLEAHIVRLLQAETKYMDNQYYRKINEDTYQCFACKIVFSASNFASHWVNCENIDDIEIMKIKEAKPSNNITEDASKIAIVEKQLVTTLQEFYDIDEINNVSICKTCRGPIPINFKSMIVHMKEEHNENDKIENSSVESLEDEVVYREFPDNGQKRHDLAVYGRAHHIKLNFNGGRGYCTMCDKHLSANKSVFRIHSRGKIHKGHLELQGLKKPRMLDSALRYSSQTVEKYLQSLQYCPEIFNVWINTAFCINRNSFFLLYPIMKNPHYVKTKCFACKEVFQQGSEREHCLTTKHWDNFIAAKVITYIGEFFREVRPNLYHCGFCNVMLPYSHTVEIHVQTLKHMASKVAKMMDSEKKGRFWRDFTSVNQSLSSGDEDLYSQIVRYVYT